MKFETGWGGMHPEHFKFFEGSVPVRHGFLERLRFRCWTEQLDRLRLALSGECEPTAAMVRVCPRGTAGCDRDHEIHAALSG